MDEPTIGEIIDIMKDVIDDIYFNIMSVDIPDLDERLENILDQLSDIAMEQNNLRREKK